MPLGDYQDWSRWRPIDKFLLLYVFCNELNLDTKVSNVFDFDDLEIRIF